jgi:universal protein Kae1
MRTLGIESTAHTFGCGIVDETCRVLANEKASYTTAEGGIHPRAAADFLFEHAPGVVRGALAKAHVVPNDIDCIAFSRGPGLGPCLEVGAIAARHLALEWHKPLIGVNHPVAHIEIAKKRAGAKDPIIVYSSGANTQVIGLEKGVYRVYGETLDTGIGNAFDNFGRALGLGFPAGPVLDQRYFEKQDYVELPYSVKGMDLAFSGLLTAAQKKIGKGDDPALAFSFMHTALAMLTEVAERALAHTNKKELVVTGGVAASRAFREMLEKMCAGRGAKLLVPPAEYCTDNGAMIGWTGLLMHRKKIHLSIARSRTHPFWRVDDVAITW